MGVIQQNNERLILIFVVVVAAAVIIAVPVGIALVTDLVSCCLVMGSDCC